MDNPEIKNPIVEMILKIKYYCIPYLKPKFFRLLLLGNLDPPLINIYAVDFPRM
jgi:hypothetical protein